MNTSELKTRLQQERFRPDVYSIGGPLPAHEGLILRKVGNTWKIEHFERGIRRELESITTEDAACARMYELLKSHFG
jgi:hypothetical protein